MGEASEREGARVSVRELYDYAVAEMRAMIAGLPLESAGVRERRRLIEAVSRDQYWLTIDAAKQQVLSLEVAPLMRYLPNVDMNRATFEIHCLNAIAALLEGDDVEAARAAAAIRNDLIRLPVDHPDIEPYRDVITSRWSEDWTAKPTVDEVVGLWRQLGPLMKHRQAEPATVITLDLADVFQEQRWIEVGPDATQFELSDYQRLVTERVHELARTEDAVGRIARGEELQAEELQTIEGLLNQPDLFADEDALQRAWRAPHASMLGILRHILDVEPLVARADAVNATFSAFLAEKSYLQADQLTFVKLFARRLIDGGQLDLTALYDHPFTALTMDPEKLLPRGDLDEMLLLARRFEVR